MLIGELMFGPTRTSELRSKIINLCLAHGYDRNEWLSSHNPSELKILLLTLEELIDEKRNKDNGT